MENREARSGSNLPKKSLNAYVKYSGIAFQMIAIILVGLFAGIKADQHFGLKFPVLTLILTLLGLGVALYVLFKEVK